ncbi:MAG: hypothetical protein HY865_22165 [Chloroflexi bacterium]|nr:hypothetical protein [Chloroflexota bacterium]
MALTRAQVESILVSRCKKRMVFVEFAITTNGSNADLNDPICTALQVMGINPANIASVADSDLATVTDAAKLCDLAEVRLLENILGNSDKVTLQAASGTEHFSNANDALEKMIARKQAEVQKKYGVGLGSLQSGKLSMSFQAKP